MQPKEKKAKPKPTSVEELIALMPKKTVRASIIEAVAFAPTKHQISYQFVVDGVLADGDDLCLGSVNHIECGIVCALSGFTNCWEWGNTDVISSPAKSTHQFLHSSLKLYI